MHNTKTLGLWRSFICTGSMQQMCPSDKGLFSGYMYFDLLWALKHGYLVSTIRLSSYYCQIRSSHNHHITVIIFIIIIIIISSSSSIITILYTPTYLGLAYTHKALAMFTNSPGLRGKILAMTGTMSCGLNGSKPGFIMNHFANHFLC